MLAALKAAREIGVVTVGFTGDGQTPMQRALRSHRSACPSDETALIQQIHITAAHAICGIWSSAICSARKRG